MHPLLAGFLLSWRERTPYAKDCDFVFPSLKLRGKKPLSPSVMVQKYLRPAAVAAGVIAADWKGRFGFHNFRHFTCDRVGGHETGSENRSGHSAPRGSGDYHEAVRTIGHGVHAGGAGKIPRAARRKPSSPAGWSTAVNTVGWTVGSSSRWKSSKFFGIMVARDGVEPPTPAFSGLRSLGLTTFPINNLTSQSGQFIVTIL